MNKLPLVFSDEYLEMLRLMARSPVVVRSMSSTVNQAELDKFSAMAKDWWNPHGVCKPLHSLNRLRVPLGKASFT